MENQAEKAVNLLKNKRKYELSLELIEYALSHLSDYNRALLLAFYVEKGRNTAEELGERYYRARSCVYTDKDKALAEFARALEEITTK